MTAMEALRFSGTLEKRNESRPMSTPAQDGRAASWELLRACFAPRAEAARIDKALRRTFDWEAATAMAADHGVLPLLARTLEEARASAGVPDATRRRLEKARRQQALFSLSLTAEFFRLAERFRAAGIDCIVVKGPVLAAQAFGDCGLRQFLDLDILLRHGDALRAARAVEECGFTSRIPLESASQRIPGQFLLVREETRAIVELHTERTLRYFPRAIPIESFFARRVEVPLDGGNAPALCPEDTLVFICVHGSKHFWERLIWIADVAGLLERRTAFDWDRVFAVARETQTERMVHLGLCLARDVLGVDLHPRAAADVQTDATAASLAVEIAQKLAAGESISRTARQRAILRVQMCTGIFRGARYLLRLTFSPTEEDWVGEDLGRRAAWIAAVRRPLRLARKHHAEAGQASKTRKAQV